MIIKNDNGKGQSYGIQKDFTQWKPLSKKITLSKMIMSIDKKDNEPLSKMIPTKDNVTKETVTKETNSITNNKAISNTINEHSFKKSSKDLNDNDQNNDVVNKGKRKLKSPAKDKTKNPDKRVREFIDMFCEKHKEVLGSKYLVDRGKDGAIVKNLLGTHTLAELNGYLIKYFQSEDAFIQTQGYSIGFFKFNLPKLKGKKWQGKTESENENAGWS